MVRQDLEREHGIVVSLRTVERAVAPLRRELRAEARATVRFETPPGCQLQIDFGETERRLAARACGYTCSWRRWTTRAAASCRRSGMSGNLPGSTLWNTPAGGGGGARGWLKYEINQRSG